MATTASTAPYTVPPGAGLSDVWWKTGRVQTKASGAETRGSFSQIETIDPRGTATPLHVHYNEEETFYVLEGEVSLFVEGARHDLSAGGFALVPRGLQHGYLVRSEVARMLVTFSPSGFEDVFVDHGVPVLEGATPPDDAVFPPVEELIQTFAAYGCAIVGPPPVL
jgi:quercetin dioxygenase-like cupin family protein